MAEINPQNHQENITEATKLLMFHLSADYIAFKNAHHFIYSLVLNSHHVPSSLQRNLCENVMTPN